MKRAAVRATSGHYQTGRAHSRALRDAVWHPSGRAAGNRLASRNIKVLLMIKPDSVTVIWSQSPELGEGISYRFTDFERRALTVALSHGQGGGYLKAKVSVRFDNDSTYECRLDLAWDICRGFRDHCQRLLAYAQSNMDKRFSDHLAFLAKVDWA